MSASFQRCRLIHLNGTRTSDESRLALHPNVCYYDILVGAVINHNGAGEDKTDFFLELRIRRKLCSAFSAEGAGARQVVELKAEHDNELAKMKSEVEAVKADVIVNEEAEKRANKQNMDEASECALNCITRNKRNDQRGCRASLKKAPWKATTLSMVSAAPVLSLLV